MTLYLGVDFGTSGCRACVIDTAGQQQGWATAPLPQAIPGESRGADPQSWWHALCQVFDQLAASIPIDQVAAIAIDGTSGTLLGCSRDGTPVTPALMYNDVRASNYARVIADTLTPDSSLQGACTSASSSLAKALYLLETYPDHGISRLLHQADWLMGRLSGNFCTSDENNALKLGYDPIERKWADALNTLGIDGALLPDVVPPGTLVGHIESSWCKRWGFSADTGIVSGTTDSTAGFIATGAGPGQAVTSLGSTLVLKVCAQQPVYSPRYGIYSHRLGDHWLVGGASNTGGTVLLKYFDLETIEVLTPQLKPQHPTGLDYYPLVSPGERFPVNNPDLMPRLEPRPADDADFFQGILEGITRIEKQGYERLAELGAPWETGL